jgi:hypothetical protein
MLNLDEKLKINHEIILKTDANKVCKYAAYYLTFRKQIDKYIHNCTRSQQLKVKKHREKVLKSLEEDSTGELIKQHESGLIMKRKYKKHIEDPIVTFEKYIQVIEDEFPKSKPIKKEKFIIDIN